MTIVQTQGQFYSVAQCVHVCYVNDYVCMHAVRITEYLSIQYKNNCQSVCKSMHMCMCACGHSQGPRAD